MLLCYLFCRKLHCLRNYIHINLMISFICLYITKLLTEPVLVDFYDQSVNRVSKQETCEEYLNSKTFVRHWLSYI